MLTLHIPSQTLDAARRVALDDGAKRRKPLREVRIEGLVAFVPLTQGMEAIIDAADAPIVGQRNWTAYRSGHQFYASTMVNVASGRRVIVPLHRFIADAKDGQYVDHINHNGLDNRRHNLRLSNNQQNCCNRPKNINNKSGYKGVHFKTENRKWVSQIRYGGKCHFLGHFNTAYEAHLAYADAAARIHGDFARAI